MKRIIVWDTETTGLLLPGAAALKDQPKIIELAAIAIHVLSEAEMKALRKQKAPEIAEVERRTWLIHPGEEISAEITKITGITNDDLRGQPSFGEVYGEIAAFFCGAQAMVAHNLPFDLWMLVNDLRRIGREFAFPYPAQQICTVAAFEHLKGRRMKLDELFKHFTQEEMKTAHRAMADAEALARIVIESELWRQ